MVNISLIEAILREQDNPGSSTTRQIRELYNARSGDDPIIQHSDDDKRFQKILLKALETIPVTGDNNDSEDDDKPISYTVKLKDSDDSTTPTMKRRSIIKLPKERSESEESSSDSEKISTTTSTSTNKPFSPLFLNNMKKFGVSSDWLAKRSNSSRHSAYSLSSVKSNTSKLDAMIKSASAKPIRSIRKLSFVESTTTSTKMEVDKENMAPTSKTNDEEGEEEEEIKDVTKTSSVPTTYDLSSEVDEDKDTETSPSSKDFLLRIPRIDLTAEKTKRVSKRSNSSVSLSSDEEVKPTKTKQKRANKKETTIKKAITKRSSKKKNKDDVKASPEKSEEADESTNANDIKDTSENDEENKHLSKRSNSSVSLSSDDEVKLETPKSKQKQASKKETTTKNAITKRSSKKKSKDEIKPSTEKNEEDDQSINADDIKDTLENDEENKRLSKRSNSSVSLSSDEEIKVEKPKPKQKRQSKKEATTKKATTKTPSKKKNKDEIKPSPEKKEEDDDDELTKNTSDKHEEDESTNADDIKDTLEKDEEDKSTKNDDAKKSTEKKAKGDQEQSRIEHLKKLLRISGIRLMIKKSELDELSSNKAKIKYLKSLFDKAGYTGSISIKDCQKFRKKRDAEKELLEIQENSVDVKGHVKGGRTLRGQGRTTDDSEFNGKRKRVASSEVEDNNSSDDDSDKKPIVKKQRVLRMEASPEVSDNE